MYIIIAYLIKNNKATDVVQAFDIINNCTSDVHVENNKGLFSRADACGHLPNKSLCCKDVALWLELASTCIRSVIQVWFVTLYTSNYEMVVHNQCLCLYPQREYSCFA